MDAPGPPPVLSYATPLRRQPWLFGSLAWIVMGGLCGTFLVLNIPSPFMTPFFVYEKGWPFRWYHICDVCDDGAQVYAGFLTVNILFGFAVVLSSGILTQRLYNWFQRRRA